MSEVVPETPAESVAPETTEPAWSGPSAEEWQATQERLAQFEAAQAPQQPQYQPPEQGPPVPDPFSETYAQDFQAYTQAQMASYNQFMQEVRSSQAEEFAMEQLDSFAAKPEIGAFDRESAYARANLIMLTNGGDPIKALEAGARAQAQHERAIGEAYHKAQLEQAQVNAGVRPGLPLGATGSQTIATGGLGNTPNAVTRKFFGTP